MEAVESEVVDFLDDFNRRKDICDFFWATRHVCAVIHALHIGKH